MYIYEVPLRHRHTSHSTTFLCYTLELYIHYHLYLQIRSSVYRGYGNVTCIHGSLHRYPTGDRVTNGKLYGQALGIRAAITTTLSSATRTSGAKVFEVHYTTLHHIYHLAPVIHLVQLLSEPRPRRPPHYEMSPMASIPISRTILVHAFYYHDSTDTTYRIRPCRLCCCRIFTPVAIHPGVERRASIAQVLSRTRKRYMPWKAKAWLEVIPGGSELWYGGVLGVCFTICLANIYVCL